MDFHLPLDGIYPVISIRDIKFSNECFILIQVIGIINAEVTLQEPGGKQKKAVSDKRKSHTLTQCHVSDSDK